MIDYIYKGFRLSYKITSLNTTTNTYQANGSALYLLNAPKALAPKTFHTELSTHKATEHEIKTLLENYVNIELTHFYNMRKTPQSVE